MTDSNRCSRRCLTPVRLGLTLGLALWLLPALALAGAGAPPAMGLTRLAESAGGALMILLLLMAKVGLVATALLVHRVRPALATASATRLTERPFTMFALGLAYLILLLFLLKLCEWVPPVQVLLLSLAAIPLVAGLTGLYSLVGAAGGRNAEDRDAGILRGGVLLETATMIPVVGQFYGLLLLIAALGAGILTLASQPCGCLRKAAPPVPVPPETPEPAEAPEVAAAAAPEAAPEVAADATPAPAPPAKPARPAPKKSAPKPVKPAEKTTPPARPRSRPKPKTEGPGTD